MADWIQGSVRKMLLLAVLMLMIGACKQRHDKPIVLCHVQPDPETGWPVCRYY